MKAISNLSIIFLIIFSIFSIVAGVKEQNKIYSETVKRDYERFMEVAVEDATHALITTEKDTSLEKSHNTRTNKARKIQLNKEKALKTFYDTFFLNLGIEHDKAKQDEFIMHIPLKMIVDYDGYYINSVIDGKETWLTKKFFKYYNEAEGIIIYYTLDDYAYIFNTNNCKWDEGTRDKLYNIYPIHELREENFDSFKRLCIITAMRKDMEGIINRYNIIAQRYGFTYSFNIPEFDDDIWENTLDGISFIAFLQGLPIYGVNEFYSTYGFSTTEIVKKYKYYGKTINGKRYYFMIKNHENINEDILFDSDVEAAKKGYYPHLESLNLNK